MRISENTFIYFTIGIKIQEPNLPLLWWKRNGSNMVCLSSSPFVHHHRSHRFLANIWFLLLCPCVLIMVESSNFTQPAIPILIGHYIIQLCQWRMCNTRKSIGTLLRMVFTVASTDCDSRANRQTFVKNRVNRQTFVKNLPTFKKLQKPLWNCQTLVNYTKQTIMPIMMQIKITRS